MTKLKNRFSLVSFSVLAAITFVTASSNASVAEKISQVCGLSDTVYEYIAKTAGEKSASQFGMKAVISSGRRLIMYKDGSWILTLEFLSTGPIEADRTCIVAKGELKDQNLATEIMKESPWIGPPTPGASTPQKAEPEQAPPENPRAAGNRA